MLISTEAWFLVLMPVTTDQQRVKDNKRNAVVESLIFRVLVDNTSSEGLLTEHGFAVWVECDGQIILFDSGQDSEDNDILFTNASAMGCDLTKVDYLVLSHGHYDHSGSIAKLLAINSKLKLVCHPEALKAERYSIYPDRPPRNIAMPEIQRAAIQALPPERILLASKPVELFAGVGFSGAIPRLHPLEDTGGPFYLDQEKVNPDQIVDDGAIWFNTGQGLVILTGCCHAGMINTLCHLRQVAGEQTIAGILGGLHLVRASDVRINATVSALVDCLPGFIIPCHCTGEEAISRLKDALREKVSDGGAGRIKLVM